MNFKRLRRTRINPHIRDLVQEVNLSIKDFIYPLFVVEGQGIKNEIASMPDVFQLSIDHIVQECKELKKLGIFHIMLFGVPSQKDEVGSHAMSENHIVARTIRAIRDSEAQDCENSQNLNLQNLAQKMCISVDLCFCEYTSHGHCGVLDSVNVVDNDKTLQNLCTQALILARAGADIIAPSGMMDGTIATLRAALDGAGFENLPIMAYSTKFASAYYGPFRDVAQSTPSFGDRRSYQQNPANRREAILESLNDESEGADILMVKPALAFLDVVRDIREVSLLPLALYNVSGEYAMLKNAQKAGLVDYERMLIENMHCFKRAGADIIISYHAKEMAEILGKN